MRVIEVWEQQAMVKWGGTRMNMNKKIVEYGMVMAGDAIHIIEEIRESLVYGWQPFGSPFVHSDIIHQAMVKYEEEE